MTIREQVIEQFGGKKKAWVILHLLYHLLVKDDELIGPELLYCDCCIAESYRKNLG